MIKKKPQLNKKVKTIYLCGGTSNLTGIEDIFADYTNIETVKPKNPFLVTPSGIAKNCIKKNRKRKKKDNVV